MGRKHANPTGRRPGGESGCATGWTAKWDLAVANVDPGHQGVEAVAHGGWQTSCYMQTAHARTGGYACNSLSFRQPRVSAVYSPSPQARVRAASQGALRRRRGPRLDVRPMATAHHRDVWAENVDAEFVAIREAIVNYPYVAMVRRSPPHLAHATPSQRTPRHPRVAVRGTPLMLPPILSTRLSAGHRVPGGCRPSHWLLQVILRLSLPDAALQRRPSEDNPDRPHPL